MLLAIDSTTALLTGLV